MTDKEIKLDDFVKEVLQDEMSRDDKFLTDDDIRLLLAEDKNEHEQHNKPRNTIFGYPSHPLFREIAKMLQIWMEERHCPVFDLPKYDLLDEKSYCESRNAVISSITPLLEGLKTLWTMWGRDEIKYRIREVLLLLGKRGMLDLLGIRKTVGTKELWPVSKAVLMASFKEKHSPNSDLWVGARALAKHFHRDNTDSWWGNSTGTEHAKNDHALRLLNLIMDNATWINIHWLPHDVIIMEMRQEKGYGARWLADGSAFRGFLEPQMVDGHDVGWKH